MSTNQILLDAGLRDAFLELTNVGIGRAAATMSELAGRTIDISVPEIEMFTPECFQEFRGAADSTVAYVVQDFDGELVGRAFILLSKTAAIHLAELLFGEDDIGGRFDETEQNSILELGNIMIGGIMGTLCNEFSSTINYDVPEIQLKGVDELIALLSPDSNVALTIRANLSIGNEDVNSNVLLVFDDKTNQNLVEKLDSLVNG